MGSRSNSVPRKSGEQMIPGITEEDEEMMEEEDEDMEVEEVDQFGPALGSVVLSDGGPDGVVTAPVSPVSPSPVMEKDLMLSNGTVVGADGERKGSGGIPLTAEALAQKLKLDEERDVAAP